MNKTWQSPSENFCDSKKYNKNKTKEDVAGLCVARHPESVQYPEELISRSEFLYTALHFFQKKKNQF